jgi:hypothetical protein
LQTTTIIMFANQITSLNLGQLNSDERVLDKPNALKSFSRRKASQILQQPRETPEARGVNPTVALNVIAATDPNDLLSFPIRKGDVMVRKARVTFLSLTFTPIIQARYLGSSLILKRHTMITT